MHQPQQQRRLRLRRLSLVRGSRIVCWLRKPVRTSHNVVHVFVLPPLLLLLQLLMQLPLLLLPQLFKCRC